MEKFIKITSLLSLALVTFFACKKDVTEVKQEDRFSVDLKVASAKGSENAVIIGTKAELKAALTASEKPIFLKKIATANNVFIPIEDEGPDPVDPGQLCWDEINAYYNAHIAGWQQAANQNCTNVMVCLTCPNAGGGLYVMYVIRPTSPKCNVLEAFEAQFSLAAFNFGNGELESEAVATHIKRK
ncbi:hypothetical protein EZ428_07790 [Pedobacter frigiditerrae]|uniref:Lipoprotein n=1 Tax=Pedobacter frigiditerrae TaxID=2530452 RepID=A0A4R0MXN8_9SPHI|nr:hypothetical protein [Pedobacter frigiditerrae]TCC91653.1 hypothetical protein EZ428_07790 [Pedobacter frigiditerrae]